MGLTGLHLLIVLGLVVLLFGATKLPALAKGVGESLRILRQETRAEDAPPPAAAPQTTAAPGRPGPDVIDLGAPPVPADRRDDRP
jgi:sec-independent protein translocase protein TatA